MFKRKFLPSEAAIPYRKVHCSRGSRVKLGMTEAFRAKLNSRQMRGSLKGLAGSLRSKSGESIMEVIVSILIFSILMTTALAIVRTSLVITGNRIAYATKLQDDVNSFVVNDDLLTRNGTINFSLFEIDIYGNPGDPIVDTDDTPVESSHGIILPPEGDILVFRPRRG